MMTVPDSLSSDAQVMVDVATSPTDRTRILREVEGRAWASSHGIRTPTTVAHAEDGAWIATQRLVEASSTSMAYVESAWETAERLGGLADPQFLTASATWRAARVTVPQRAVRLQRAGISPTLFVRARRAVAALPHEVTAHLDYHRENVLNTPALGGVTVLDWEFSGRGPRHLDFIRLIVDLEPDGLAHAAWLLLLDRTRDRHHHQLATQLRWLTLRTWASEVDLPTPDVQPVKASRRRRRWLLAQQWAGEVADP